MTQQQQHLACPDGTAAFKEVVLSAVRYHLLTDGPDKTREFFYSQRGFYAHVDGWPEIVRQVDAMIQEYVQAQRLATTVPLEQSLPNLVFKRNHQGRPIDFRMLHRAMDRHFVSEVLHGYDWLAGWRITHDLQLLEVTRLSPWADQMNAWYPQAAKPCSADTMGDYFNPYLGTTPFDLWDEAEFMRRKSRKQSLTGFRRLYNLCQTLKDQLCQLLVVCP